VPAGTKTSETYFALLPGGKAKPRIADNADEDFAGDNQAPTCQASSPHARCLDTAMSLYLMKKKEPFDPAYFKIE
jgi:hypothetical protein